MKIYIQKITYIFCYSEFNVLFFSFLFCFLTIAHLKSIHKLIYIYWTFFCNNNCQLSVRLNTISIHTSRNVFTIDYTVKNNLFLFLISVFFAVATRILIALSLIYVFFNHKKIYSYFSLILSVFFLINFKLRFGSKPFQFINYLHIFPLKKTTLTIQLAVRYYFFYFYSFFWLPFLVL